MFKLYILLSYGCEREIVAYKSYFWDFMDTLTENESKKIYYILDMLKSEIVYPKNL